ncbi:MAG TPA: serine/threonine-protein kinase, partial [Bacillales bacterium]|nr:serine/threonine-protein kinase [Bacillales bacterium]
MSISLKGEILGGKYDIQAQLGEGGSCIVYLAKKLNSTERYAIKTLSTEEEDAIKLLERETKTLKRLNHPNIVKFIEEGYEARHKLVYLVLEYLEGQNIKDYFDSGIDLKTLLDIFLQIIDGISHAHSKDIIHRDIKPDNIKIVDTGERPAAKVLDFGIAIITTTILTNTIKSYHTPLFSAPEQINLEGVSRDSDIYSLGMTFLYLLSSQHSRSDFQEALDKAVLYNSAEEILGNFNASSLIDILKKTTDKHREKRPKIDEIRKAIANLKEELAERMTVRFSITDPFQKQISNKYNFQQQIVKIKRHIESELKDDSGVLYINKSSKQTREDRLAVEILIESLSKIYYGFINCINPTEVVLHNEPNFINYKTQEIIIEKGVAVKVDPIVNLGDSPIRKTDISELLNLILEKEQEVKNEAESKESIKLTFEQWQSVIDIEKKIISDKKQVFNYKHKYYESQDHIVILTLQEPISIEQFDRITSPALDVTISVKRLSSSNQQKNVQWAIGKIVDGEKSSNGELIEKLHISIGDFCDP